MKHQAGRADAAEDFRAAQTRRLELDFAAHPEGRIVERLTAFHYGDFLLGHDQFQEVIRLLEPLVAEGGETERSRLAGALVRLVLGRAYLAQWTSSYDPRARHQAGEALQQAVDGIRQADREDCLPPVLLGRSRYRLHAGQLEAAWQDIHEAFRVVERRQHEALWTAAKTTSRLAVSVPPMPTQNRGHGTIHALAGIRCVGRTMAGSGAMPTPLRGHADPTPFRNSPFSFGCHAHGFAWAWEDDAPSGTVPSLRVPCPRLPRNLLLEVRFGVG